MIVTVKQMKLHLLGKIQRLCLFFFSSSTPSVVDDDADVSCSFHPISRFPYFTDPQIFLLDRQVSAAVGANQSRL